MDIKEIAFAVPEGFQLIIGQSHFIKTVEDIYETLAAAVPGGKFGIAFCEASGPALVRFDGTDLQSSELAKELALKLGAGHAFVVVLNGMYPVNVLGRLRAVDEVVGIYCATSNPVSVLVADTKDGRAILGVADGARTKGVESDADKTARHKFLRDIGYKK
ncbi:MAG TPA: adenosine-specific kinase [Nitrososphaerales archaeon]|nr:adenosine-specific kinase [Nitrososphaerales archaeon]